MFNSLEISLALTQHLVIIISFSHSALSVEGRQKIVLSLTFVLPFSNICHHFMIMEHDSEFSQYTLTIYQWILQWLSFSVLKNQSKCTSTLNETSIQQAVLTCVNTHWSHTTLLLGEWEDNNIGSVAINLIKLLEIKLSV